MRENMGMVPYHIRRLQPRRFYLTYPKSRIIFSVKRRIATLPESLNEIFYPILLWASVFFSILGASMFDGHRVAFARNDPLLESSGMHSSASASGQSPVFTLQCLTAQDIRQIKIDPDVMAIALRPAVEDLASDLARWHLDRDSQAAIFASVVARHIALYGNSDAYDFKALLNAPALTCENYAALTGYLL